MSKLMGSLYKPIGVLRSRPRGPGFGVVVYECDGSTYVRSRATEKSEGSWHKCAVPLTLLRDLPARATLRELPEDGFAFEFPDGEIALGSRSALRSVIRARIAELASYPFVGAEVSRFIEDEELVQEFERRCRFLVLADSISKRHGDAIFEDGTLPETVDRNRTGERLMERQPSQLENVRKIAQPDGLNRLIVMRRWRFVVGSAVAFAICTVAVLVDSVLVVEYAIVLMGLSWAWGLSAFERE